MAIGVPGCPLLAACTASIDSVRIVLMASCSIDFDSFMACSLPGGIIPRRCANCSTAPARLICDAGANMSFESDVQAKAIEIGKLSVEMTTAAGSGHPSTALSLAHLVTVL